MCLRPGVLTAWYFLHFILVLPLLGLLEKPKPLPTSISQAVLGTKAAASLAVLLAGAALFLGTPTPASAQEHDQPPPPRNSWSFHGMFGRYDPGQLQRGFKVYREVCQNCHSRKLVAFRNLEERGGPEFTEAQVAAIAAEYKVKDGPIDQGEMFERLGRPADHFRRRSPTSRRAPANSGALPPDMSVLAKARQYARGFPWFVFAASTQYQELGVDYIVSVLKGYAPKPADVTIPSGMQYNVYFPGHAIGMPPPLSDGVVSYTDGAPETLEQYSKDIAAFLMWAAEPTLDARKRIGFQVLIYLLILSGLLYFTKKKIWHDVHAPTEAAPGQDPKPTTL
jgi:ubiquinol-cytochrome c reductase cytochrome b/c1 subunit